MAKKFHIEHMAEGVTLILGDCLEVLPTLKKVDLVVTSPPYDGLRTYGGHGEVNTLAVISHCAKLLNKGGVLMWNVSDQTKDGSETGTSFRQALHAMSCGLLLHDTMIYIKPGTTYPSKVMIDGQRLDNRYFHSFEYMFVLSKGPPKHFNGIKDRKNKIVGHRAPSAYRQIDGTLKQKVKVDADEFGLRYNYWIMANNPVPEFGANKHPARMPKEMAEGHIRTWTDKGEVVLDPFMGIGTTGIAAIELGRKFVGIEIESKSFDTACKRIYKTLRNPNFFVDKPVPHKQKGFNETWVTKRPEAK